MEKILGSCSLLSLYHYYSILLIIIIPLVLITTPLPDPLPLILFFNPKNNYSQKSLLLSLSFSLLFRICLAHRLLCDFLFPYFSLFLSIFYQSGRLVFPIIFPFRQRFFCRNQLETCVVCIFLIEQFKHLIS